MRKNHKQVVFISRLFYPHIGGVEKHMEKLCEALIKRGYEITLVTSLHDKNLKRKEDFKGVKIIRIPVVNLKFVGLFNIWLSFIKLLSLFINADVIHIHDVFIWYWPIKLLLPHKKVYLTIHGQWGKYPISINDKLQKKIAVKFSTANLSIGEYLPKNYGYKAGLVSYGATDIPKSTSKKDDGLIIYVGRLDSDLTVQKFIEFAKSLNKFKIEFVGDGEMRKRCEKVGKVHGFTNPYPYYKKAKYVFASGYLTILESMAHKCLVFCSYTHKLHEDYYKLTPFGKSIICEKSPGKLLERFKFYSGQSSKLGIKNLERIIKRNYEWVSGQTWRKMADTYEDLWKY